MNGTLLKRVGPAVFGAPSARLLGRMQMEVEILQAYRAARLRAHGSGRASVAA